MGLHMTVTPDSNSSWVVNNSLTTAVQLKVGNLEFFLVSQYTTVIIIFVYQSASSASSSRR